VNAFDEDRNGSTDIFIAKFNPTLSELEYATYIGGNGDDTPRGFDVDVSGNAYVTGVTYSTDFPISPQNPDFLYQDGPVLMKTVLWGLNDGFFFKLGQFGDVLKYSTYFGGFNQDAGNDVVVAGSNMAVIVGESRGTGIVTTDNAYNQSNSGGYDCLIIKVATGLNYYGYKITTSFLGGAGNDGADSVVLDNEDNMYITGYTYS
ncbi:MAG: SBBP repeat-containing protein, partial [Candidatus Thorarchaeota archaeon]